MEIRKAQRKKAKLRLGIAAPSGAGKTYSALLLAFGIGGKVGVIDTEHGSADLYADLGDYDIIAIEAPYTVPKYLEAIKAFESAGYTTIIIDSLTHAWAGDGGLLDKQGKIADSGKANGFAAWRTITPEHNALVESMLKSPCHIIATMRSKQEYVLETNDRGKQTPKKIGLAPVQRDGMEYEFTIMFDIDMAHVASASKDRTSLFDGRYFKVNKDTGIELLEWLESGEEVLMKVSPDARDDLLARMADAGLSAPRFCEKFEVESVSDLLSTMVEPAKQAIESFKVARDAARAAKLAAEQQTPATEEA
jgi:hypothetical protein